MFQKWHFLKRKKLKIQNYSKQVMQIFSFFFFLELLLVHVWFTVGKEIVLKYFRSIWNVEMSKCMKNKQMSSFFEKWVGFSKKLAEFKTKSNN